MNWDAIGALGEVAGALVVIISVVYLASQVRQNTAVSRADALRTISIEISRGFQEWGQTERGSEIWHKVLYERVRRSDLAPADAISASFSIISRFSLYDAAFRSYKEGILTEDELRQVLTTRVFDLPFTKDSWPMYRQELSSDFVAYLEMEKPQLLDIDSANET
jgi:hypothetical protein